MNNQTRTAHVIRGNILMLLTDDEVASVCTAETTVRPLEGEEYLDLEDLGQGVRRVRGSAPPMSRLLLRRAVQQKTWNKILKELAVLRTEKAPPLV